jgi:hypothetical protein
MVHRFFMLYSSRFSDMYTEDMFISHSASSYSGASFHSKDPSFLTSTYGTEAALVVLVITGQEKSALVGSEVLPCYSSVTITPLAVVICQLNMLHENEIAC